MRTYLTVVFLFFLIGSVLPPTLSAKTPEPVQLIALEDSYVSLPMPSKNFDGDATLQFSTGYVPDDSGPLLLYCPQITRQVFLKFDLSSIQFPIERVRLRLMAVADDVEAIPSIYLLGSADSWNERNVTWYGRPASLAGPFRTVSKVDSAGALVWLDDAQSDSYLAEWLETQRQQNGGDGLATLSLTLPISLGCWPADDPPADNYKLMLMNRLSSTPPLLEIASADSELPALPETTAVTLLSQQTMLPPHIGVPAGLLLALTLILKRE